MDYLVAILVGGGFTALIEITKLIVSRKDKKQEEKEQRMSTDRKLARIQMLLLISDYPERVDEIMEVSYDYFIKQKGNYYAHNIFTKYLEEHGLEKPDWFK